MLGAQGPFEVAGVAGAGAVAGVGREAGRLGGGLAGCRAWAAALHRLLQEPRIHLDQPAGALAAPHSVTDGQPENRL